MKRFLVAALIGLGIGYLLMRLSQRRLLLERLAEEDEIADSPAPAP